MCHALRRGLTLPPAGLPLLGRAARGRSRDHQSDRSASSRTTPARTQPERTSQIAGVQVLPVFDSLGRLQDHRQIAETAIVDQVPERFQPHLTRPDSRVAVDAAAAARDNCRSSARRGAWPSPTDRLQPLDRLIVLLRRLQ